MLKRLVPALALLTLPACGRDETVHVNPFGAAVALRDPAEAPAPLQKAARGIVRIRSVESLGTGFFMTPKGILMTNEHVLGRSNCLREGCWVTLSFGFGKGTERFREKRYFASPVASNVALDMSVFEIRDAPTGKPIATPDFLRLAPTASEGLAGKTLHTIGHPHGNLKKWTSGQMLEPNGDWLVLTNLVFSGNSGSPILDDEGNAVGLVHRSLQLDESVVTATGANTLAMGTSGAALLKALSGPDGTLNLAADPKRIANLRTTAEVEALWDKEFSTAVLLSAAGGRMPEERLQERLGGLREECRTELAGLRSHAELETPQCRLAWKILNCSGSGPKVCPDRQEWLAVAREFIEKRATIQGAPSFQDLRIVEKLFEKPAEGRAFAWDLARPRLKPLGTLTPEQALIAAEFGELRSFAGTDLVEFFRNYRAIPNWRYRIDEIVTGQYWLYRIGEVSAESLVGLLETLAIDPEVSIELRLALEAEAFRARKG